MAVTTANLGWFVTGVVSGIIGGVSYGGYPLRGIFYIEIGIVAIIIGLVIGRSLTVYKKAFRRTSRKK